MADDLLQGLKDIVGNAPAAADGGDIGDDPEATVAKFLKALESMPGLSAEDKENLAKGLLQGGLGGLGGGGGSQLPVGSPVTNPWLEFVILFGLISFIVLVLAYIGYRLYNSMLERERKKELKKLQKGQKKKK